MFPYLRNVLLVNSSADHLKVGDFGLSKLIKVQNSHDVYKMTGETGSCKFPLKVTVELHKTIAFNGFSSVLHRNNCKDRYMAPEVFKHRRYDKKVDVFSFAMILYEVMLVCPRCKNQIRLSKKRKEVMLHSI